MHSVVVRTKVYFFRTARTPAIVLISLICVAGAGRAAILLTFFEGELKTRQWRSQNGEDRFTTEIMVNYFPKKLPKYFKRDAQGAQNGVAVPSGQTSQESPPIDNYDWDDIPL